MIGPHASDGPALVEEVRADDPAVQIGDHAPDRRVRDEAADEVARGLERREVAREAVVVVDSGERLVDDAGGRVAVAGLDRAQLNRSRGQRIFGGRKNCGL